MQEYHDGRLAGHFSGPRLYKTLVWSWWWSQMYTDAMNYANSCPQCAIVEGMGRRQKTTASTYCYRTSLPNSRSGYHGITNYS